MSRIGDREIQMPEGTTLDVDDKNHVTVKGPKGALTCAVHSQIQIKKNDNTVTLHRLSSDKEIQALHGLYNSLITNMVIGVTDGYKKSLELVGVGYKANNQGNILELNLGYSHNIFIGIPKELTVKAEMAKGKNPIVHIEGIDKQLVGQIAAKIKFLRKPEPYKGKGVRYLGEYIRRKAGKAAAK